MKVYTWFRSSSRATADRCALLFNTSAAQSTPNWGTAYPVRARVIYDPATDLDQETDPPLYGFPVGAGSEAGDNLGAAVFASARAAIGASTSLTQAEKDELVGYCAQEEDIDHAWWSNPDSPDFIRLSELAQRLTTLEARVDTCCGSGTTPAAPTNTPG